VWAVLGKFFQGDQSRHPLTTGHFQLRLEKQQSLLIPCGASPDVTDFREKRNQG